MMKLGRVACVLGLTLSLGCGENLLDDAKKKADEEGNGDRNTDGTRNADVPPPADVMGDTPVSDLGNDEAQELCEWQGKLLDDTLGKLSPDVVCTFAGVGAPDAQQCAMIVDQCTQAMAQGGDMPPPDEKPDCSKAQLPPAAANCAATVQEIESCMAAQVDAFITAISSLSCDSAGKEPAPPAEPDACKALEAKCPGIFDGGMGMGMGDLGGPIGPGGDGDMTPPDGATCPDGTPTDDPSKCPPPDGQQCPDPNGCPDQPPPDGQDGFPCMDGSTVTADKVCDGTPDCKGGEDEMFCGADQPPPPPSGN
jgi:hypothetical protein